MSANIFKIDGDRIDSLEDFLARESGDGWKNLLYYPEKFTASNGSFLVFREKRFTEISFKDTHLHKIHFIGCHFQKCLFIGGRITECEFIGCTFEETNTSKCKVSGCLIDPLDFVNNFDLRSDTNIAVDLYHTLYKNNVEEHQPKRAVDSLYRMKRAEYFHLDSQLKRKRISLFKYLSSKCWHVVNNLTFGYGLKTYRVFTTLIGIIGIFSIINYLFRANLFEEKKITSIWDSIYFTCVTVTTLGYGDITPISQTGKLLVTVETLAGIVLISLFLSSVAKKALSS